ncbi:MAG: protein kinase [Gemmatimonadaceae bacterium]|nr:protein kinase [Gemmatimonadaceae bacterium]
MDPVLERLRTRLSGRYEVEHELGRGGMAVVYLAMDLRHGRRVAVKLLRSDLGAAGSAERFLREIRTVAQLHHPHILALHDSGNVDGHLYYVMPYVEGETLREKLEREGPLPVSDAIRIAREVADALAYAHGRGIVHRDIKPENIFLSAGHALVADFGIARAVPSAAETTLTDVGLAVGTPAYMSPEQATAEPKIDGRSDQYALGCVLYEMLSGAPPFTGPTSQAIMARHTADPVPPLRTVRDVPVALESAINRALAKAPADRWSDVTAFGAALDAPSKHRPDRARRRILLAAVVAAVAFTVIGGAWAIRSATADDIVGLRSLALRPFVPIGDSVAVLYAEGMPGQLLLGLHRLEGIAVKAPPRSVSAGDEFLDDVEAGRRFGVDAVLSGEIRIVGGEMRVTPRLTRVRDGGIIWTDQFNAELADVFDVQDSIAVDIVAALVPRLGAEQRAVVTRGRQTRDQEAHRLYLKARQLITQVTPQSVEQAIVLLEDAVSRDSAFADAWAALADAYSFEAQVGARRPVELASAMRRAIQKVIDLDDRHGEAFTLRGSLQGMYDWNWDEALRDFQRAVTLSPGSAGAWLGYAQFLNLLAEHDSALASMKRSIALDSLSAFAWANLSFRYRMVGLVDSAIIAAEHALALDSTQWVASFGLSEFYHADGRTADALRALNDVNRYAEDGPASLAWRATAYARLSRTTEARDMANRLIALARTRYVPNVYIGMAQLVTGDTAGALASLERSAQEREFDLTWEVGGGAYYSALKGNPLFEAVRREIFKGRRTSEGLPPPRAASRSP